jgi:hypothetical protein
MKQTLWVLLMFLSFFAFAGTSNQDPNVAKIRGEFTAAKPASSSDLTLDKQYNCFSFQAWKDAFGILTSKVTFTRFDGLLFMSISYSNSTPEILSVTESQNVISAKNPQTDDSTSRDLLDFRVGSNGVLYIEETHPGGMVGEEKSIGNPKGTTQNFTLCQAP